MHRIGINHLLVLNDGISSEFIRHSSIAKRQISRVEHPTEIGMCMCMDSRVSSAIMGRPLGIIQSWRNIGGRFDLFNWSAFQGSVSSFIDHADRKKRPLLWIISDHFSASRNELGCLGYNYDRAAAQIASNALKGQFDLVFRGRPDTAVVHMSIETDSGGLVLYGEHEVWDLSQMNSHIASRDIRDQLKALYQCNQASEMPVVILNDLAACVSGNIAYRQEIRTERRPPRRPGHEEWVLCVGQDFSWMPENTALIIGSHDPEFAKVVRTAADLLSENMQRAEFDSGRGAVLMASAKFTPGHGDVSRRLAERQALWLAGATAKILEESHPALLKQMSHLTGVIDMKTYRFYPIES